MKSFFKFLVFCVFLSSTHCFLDAAFDASSSKKERGRSRSPKSDDNRARRSRSRSPESGDEQRRTRSRSPQSLSLSSSSSSSSPSSSSSLSSVEQQTQNDTQPAAQQAMELSSALVPYLSSSSSSSSLLPYSTPLFDSKLVIYQYEPQTKKFVYDDELENLASKLRTQISRISSIKQEDAKVLAQKSFKNGNNVLHMFAFKNAIESLAVLLNSGEFNVDCLNDIGFSPLMVAIMNQSTDAAKLLVEKYNASFRLPPQYQDEFLRVLIVHMPSILESLSAKKNLSIYNYRSNEGKNIFKFVQDSQCEDSQEIVASLVKNFLEKLAICDEKEISKVILNQSCIEIKPVGASKEETMLQELYSQVVDWVGLSLRTQVDNTELTKKIIELSNSYGEKTGNSALHYAAIRGIDLAVLKRLLDTKHFNVNASNHQGDSPLVLAIECGRPEMVELFLSAGAELINSRRTQEQLLHLVIDTNQASIVYVLTKNRYILYALRDESGKNIFQIAKQCGKSNDLLFSLLITNLKANVRSFKGRKEFIASFVQGIEGTETYFIDEPIADKPIEDGSDTEAQMNQSDSSCSIM